MLELSLSPLDGGELLGGRARRHRCSSLLLRRLAGRRLAEVPWHSLSHATDTARSGRRSRRRGSSISLLLLPELDDELHGLVELILALLGAA